MSIIADNLMETVEWEAVAAEVVEGDDLPYVTHQGKLIIAGVELDVVQLSTGERLITEESISRFLNLVTCTSPDPPRTSHQQPT